MRVFIVVVLLVCCAALASACDSSACEAYCDKIEECGKGGAEQCRDVCDSGQMNDCDPFLDCVASHSCQELDDGACDKLKRCY